ncbi:uncharacterized protein H6S33_000294 [Morchella sextelata]|uniref:uncharacterized protein n=1 Tax=Morchella sextelata TaxID=1174677 RepID=UPI001D058CC9|nr:uncharacterized protein H6S33_000294 [Morchella sextelata]KAH0614658.1 hypothetical protein H6S33_000294 [Morchella sextelata]
MPQRESQFHLSNSSRPSQNTYRETSSRRNTRSFSRDRRPTTQRHVRSSQEIPSTFPHDSARRLPTRSSQARGQETESEDDVSGYGDLSQRASQIDLQLHGEMYLTKDGRVNARQPTSPPLSSLPPQESQFQQSSSRDTLPSAARNRQSDANQPYDTFYASPGRSNRSPTRRNALTSQTHTHSGHQASESIRTSSGGTRPEARRQISELSRPASIRAPSEVVRSTDYASGSGGGYSGESSSQNLLAPVDPTDPNKTRALRHRSLGQFNIELRTLIEKAGWHLTKETLFKNPMPYHGDYRR